MESLKRSIKFQLMNSKKFILIFWSVLIAFNIFSYVMNNLNVGGSVTNDGGSVNFQIGLFAGNSGGLAMVSVAGANLLVIFITLIVYNYSSIYERLPLSLSLSMTRKDYFFSFLIDNVLIAFVFASIQGILLKIDPFFIKLIGKNPFYDYGLFNVKTDNVFFIISILFIAFLGFMSFWNLIASLNYKFGYKMWLVFLGIIIIQLFLNLSFINNGISNIGEMFMTKLGFLETLIVLSGMLILYTLDFLVIKRTNVKKALS